jgi:hypothetical protein
MTSKPKESPASRALPATFDGSEIPARIVERVIS